MLKTRTTQWLKRKQGQNSMTDYERGYLQGKADALATQNPASCINRLDIIRMAREAGFADGVVNIVGFEGFERFAALVAAHEREKVAKWMVERGYATGHGDTVEDLLTEIDWQVAEREREACRLVVLDNSDAEGICCTDDVLEAFRQRGEK